MSDFANPGRPLIEVLEWDSMFWGVRAARLNVETPTDLAALDAERKRLQVDWEMFLVPIDQQPLLNQAVRLGFDIVDIRHTMTRSVETWEDARGTVDFARPSESARLTDIVRGAFSKSRFYADNHLDRTRCDDFYEAWVANSFDGTMADYVVVHRTDSAIDGFISVKLQPGGNATLSLVAVAIAGRGAGIGAHLVKATMSHLKRTGISSVTVATQLANIPALSLYSRSGFRPAETSVWLHRWSNAFAEKESMTS